ncbi:hypothetical protein AKO1_015208 [Acrasis kona]|uniref:Tet-like 2OG-Fe(II) oxygenase domain-containing protein n=1 Tax=Acrasis kona TaxID=1008807 RepID=A0AAW2ZQS6_9EUKA
MKKHRSDASVQKRRTRAKLDKRRRKYNASDKRKEEVSPLQGYHRKVEYIRTKGPSAFDDGPFPEDVLKQPQFKDWNFLHENLNIITDKETKGPVAIIKFTKFSDLSKNEPLFFDELQSTCRFLNRQFKYSSHITINSAHKRAGSIGKCIGLGYRKAFERGWDFGRYMPKSSVQKCDEKLKEWNEDQQQLPEIEEMIQRRFQLLAPHIYDYTVEQATLLQAPAISQLNFSEKKTSHASNLFVSKGYASAEHDDKDAQDWVFGFFVPIFSDDGEFATIGDQYDGTGSEFCFTEYKTVVCFNKCDGIVEIAWKGKSLHCTLPPKSSPQFTRLGASTQIPNSLANFTKREDVNELAVKDLVEINRTIKCRK